MLMREIRVGYLILWAPYYDTLLVGVIDNGHVGQLPKDFGAHALWHYYVKARRALEKIQNEPIYEGDASPRFHAYAIMKATSFGHQISIPEMVGYWPVVWRQRQALGLSMNADLPDRYMYPNQDTD